MSRVFVVLLFLTLCGCGPSTHLADLLDRPDLHDGEVVEVRGTAGAAAALAGLGGFMLHDDDRSIVVLTDGGVPPTGRELTVHGTFVQAIAIGGFEQAVIVRADTVLFQSLLALKTRGRP